MCLTLASLALFACEPQKADPSQDAGQGSDVKANETGAIKTFPEDSLVESADSEIRYVPDSASRVFDRSFAALQTPGERWSWVRFSLQRATAVLRSRSSYSAGEALYRAKDESGVGDDEILLRLEGPEPFVIAYTEGGSGDPGFYSIRLRDGLEGDYIAGDAIAVPDSGEAVVYQSSNAMFGRLKRLTLEDGVMRYSQPAREPVNLRSIVLGPLRIRRSPDDTSVVATLQRGDSVFVHEAIYAGDDLPRLFEVSTPRGVRGWVRLPPQQCYMQLIKGICFRGD